MNAALHEGRNGGLLPLSPVGLGRLAFRDNRPHIHIRTHTHTHAHPHTLSLSLGPSSQAVKKYPDVVHCLVARSPHEGQPGARGGGGVCVQV